MKSAVKIFLIVVLTIVTILTCCACNKNKGSQETFPITTPKTLAEYFGTLKTASADVGSRQFSDSDDVMVHAELSVSLSTSEKLFDLCVAASVILDRDTGKYSAAKLSIGDRDHEKTTMYLFLDDADQIYVERGSQKFKIAADLNGWNGELYKILNDLTKSDNSIKIGANEDEDLEGATISECIDELTADMGADWSLATAVESIASIANIDIKSLPSLICTVSKLLLGTKAEKPNPLTLDTALVYLGSALFLEEKTTATQTEEGSLWHTETGDGKLLKKLGSLLSGDAKLMLTNVFSNFSNLTMDYGVDNSGAIDGLNLGVQLNLGSDKTMTLGIGIGELSFSPVAAENNASLFGISKQDFADFYEVDAKVNLKFEDDIIVLNAQDGTVDFDGEFEIRLLGYFDLVHKKGIENKTDALISFSYNNQTVIQVDIDNISTADKNNYALVATFDNNVKLTDGQSITATFFNNYGALMLNELAGVDEFDENYFHRLATDIANAMFINCNGVEDFAEFYTTNCSAENFQNLEWDYKWQFDPSFKGCVVDGWDLMELWNGIGLWSGDASNWTIESILGGAGSDDEPETAVNTAEKEGVVWLVDIYKTLGVVYDTFSHVDSAAGGIQTSQDLSNLLTSIWVDDRGCSDMEGFMYGEKIGNEWLAGILGSADNEVEDWISFYGSPAAWSKNQTNPIRHLLEEGTASIKLDFSPQVEMQVKIDNATITIGVDLDVNAKQTIPNYTEFHSGFGSKDQPVDGYVYANAKEIAQAAEEPEIVIDNDISYTEFGSYPQKEVTNSATLAKLNAMSGEKPTAANFGNWTSYEYYINGEIAHYMWYMDVDCEGKKYRGVYFTQYRPTYTTSESSEINAYQDNSFYYTGNVYWFEWQPIKWQVVDSETASEGGQDYVYKTLVANYIVDCQEFYIDVDSHVEGDTRYYSNNYEMSTIRDWLNDTFYNSAFSDTERAKLMLTEIDNSTASTISRSNVYTCADTEDYVWMLSYTEAYETYYENGRDRIKVASDYTLCQGIFVNLGDSIYWTRTPYGGHLYEYGVHFIGGDGSYVDRYVTDQTCGVVPVIRIKVAQ